MPSQRKIRAAIERAMSKVCVIHILNTGLQRTYIMLDEH